MKLLVAMSASEKVQRNKKAVAFEDGTKSTRESRSRSRGKYRDRRAKSMDVRSNGNNNEVEPKKRDRSLITLVRQGSRRSVSSLVKIFEAGKNYYMSEGRKSQIILPDERRLDILIQPKLYASELLDIVSSHFKLKEKEYFGIAFQDETGHYNWLQLDKKVLEHDLPRKQGTNLVLSFLVRFYLEQITQLRDSATVELFYLNAKQSVFKGHIECDSETVFELAAHVLQTTHGDYIDDATTKADLKKLPLITTSALKEHPSIQYCEERVISYYTKLEGTTRGSAIVNYMTIVESLPTYGIHYFDVKDKKDIPWWLGISNKGIAVFDKNDKNVPRRVFVWKNLENLYYRDKKFSIEVHDPKRIVHTLSSFNLYEDAIREPIYELDELSDALTDPSTQVSVSRRTFGPGNVNVHAWFGATAQLTKCIWSMAVAQHQFYHDRKNSRAVLPSVRSVSDIANELSRSTSSLHGSLGSDISRSGSSASLPSLGASRFDLNFDPADTAKVQREMFSALKARREALDDILRKKTEELKLLCVKEGELTGILPPETPLAPGEEPPQIRRRVGTAFALDVDLSTDKEDEDRAGKLELELELQKQITSAAHKLASDKSVSRFVRKQRRHSFMKATSKMKEMEKKLNEYRKLTGKSVTSPSSSGSHDGPPVVPPSPLVPRAPRSNYNQHEGHRDGLQDSPIHRPLQESPVHRPSQDRLVRRRHSDSPVHRPLPESPVHRPIPESPVHRASPESTCHRTIPESPVHRPTPESTSHRTIPESPVHQPFAAEPRELTAEEREIVTNSPSQSSTTLDSGYTANSVYSTQYRNQNYPTLTTRSQSTCSNSSDYDNNRKGLSSSQGRLNGSQDSGFSSSNNMYNVSSRRTSRYQSNQDIGTPNTNHLESSDNAYKPPIHTKHGSFDDNSRKPSHTYGSLERNSRKRNDRRFERKYSDSDNSELANITPSKFGSNRTSQSEYDLSSKGKRTEFHNDSEFVSSRGYDPGFSAVTSVSSLSSHRHDRSDLPPQPAPRRNLIEVPVMHEGRGADSHRSERKEPSVYGRTSWQEAPATQPSPVIRSPVKSHSDSTISAHNDRVRGYSDVSSSRDRGKGYGDTSSSRGYSERPSSRDRGGGDRASSTEQRDSTPHVNCYSPRGYESSLQSHSRPPHTEHVVNMKRVDSPHTVPQATSSKIVTIAKSSPHVEVAKPFEMSDFYKYSEKLRRQRLVDQYHQALMGSRSSTPSQHSSDGESHSTSRHRSHNAPGTPSSRRQYLKSADSPSSSPFGSPLSSRHMPTHSQAPGNYTSHTQDSVDSVGLGGSRTNVVSSTSTSYDHGVSTSTSRVQYTVQTGPGRVLYKSQHQSTRHTHYQPPAAMTCDAVREVGKLQSGGSVDSPSHTARRNKGHHQRQYSTPERSNTPSMNTSFNLSPPGSLSRAFSTEMLEWYDNETQPPTSV